MQRYRLVLPPENGDSKRRANSDDGNPVSELGVGQVGPTIHIASPKSLAMASIAVEEEAGRLLVALFDGKGRNQVRITVEPDGAARLGPARV